MSTEKELITAIIVTYNSSKFIEKCIKSLVEFWPSGYYRKIIVVDNKSGDSTKKVVGKYRNKNIDLLVQHSNLGFSKAVNVGIHASLQSHYFLLINPDTVIRRNALLNMVQETKKRRAGIAGGKTVGFNGQKQGDHFRKINLSVGIFDFTNLRKLYPNDYWHKYFYYEDVPASKNTVDVDGVTGGFMLITGKTVNKIGYLDEKYFMYLEDMDYCLRAKKAGMQVIYVPSATARHFGGGSSNNRSRSNSDAWTRSRSYYFLKYFNIIENFLMQPLFYIDSIFIKLRSFSKS